MRILGTAAMLLILGAVGAGSCAEPGTASAPAAAHALPRVCRIVAEAWNAGKGSSISKPVGRVTLHYGGSDYLRVTSGAQAQDGPRSRLLIAREGARFKTVCRVDQKAIYTPAPSLR